MKAGKELDKQSSQRGGRRECWRVCAVDNINLFPFLSFHKCLSVLLTSSQYCEFPQLSSVSVWVVCSFPR